MSQLSVDDREKIAELQQLCDECRQAIETQNDSKLKAVMQEACDKCRNVRLLVPELMELRRKAKAFTAELKSA